MNAEGAAGRWAPGSAALSTAVASILTSYSRVGTFRRSCPLCDRGPKDQALAVTIEPDGRAMYYCHRCHMKGVGGTYRRRSSGTPNTRSSQQRQTLSHEGRELWRSCRHLSEEAQSYLECRRCVVPPPEGHLRWHARLRHPSGHVGPALVALVTDAVTCTPLTLHRTWISSDGTKAAIEKPRLLLGGHRKAGGVIRLWPDEAVSHGLAVAEGVETALAAAHAFTPVWSCIDAGNLASLPVLAAIDVLTIFADHDSTGLTSATTLGLRWADAGRSALIVSPAREGFDIADEVTK